MKKIIAFMLCGASSCFGLNMPTALKPNPLSQSWSNLSFTSKAMIIAASVVSLAGILYAAWPISEQEAWDKVHPEFLSAQKIINDQIKQDSSPEEIKKIFDGKRNPAIFLFGSWWNRNAFHIKVDIFAPEDQPRLKILTLVLKNVNTKDEKRCEYRYDSSDALRVLNATPWQGQIFKDNIQRHPNKPKST